MGIMDAEMDDLKYELEEEARAGTRIKVIGVGGGGCNAVARMVAEGLDGVEFYAMNTDLQALAACHVPNKLQLGVKVTNGLGAGSNPETGRQAALENTDAIVELLQEAVQGISDIIVTPGLINRDFSDIKATMSGMGYAMMGTAIGRGEQAAVDAARQAISCPLLEDSRIAGSRGILINITGSSRLGLHEVNEACSIIREAAQCEDVQINFGVILNESMEDAVKITVIATGFLPENAPMAERHSSSAERHSSSAPGIKVQPRPPEPEPVRRQVERVPTPEPAPAQLAESEPGLELDMDDLYTPAYLRQGRLLN